MDGDVSGIKGGWRVWEEVLTRQSVAYPGSRWSLRLRLRWLWPEEHDDIADTRDEMAAGLFCELWGEFPFLLFVVVELHLDQFVMFQCVIQGGQELRAQTFLAHLQRRFESLCLGFEITYLGIGQTIHRQITQIRPKNHAEFNRGFPQKNLRLGQPMSNSA